MLETIFMSALRSSPRSESGQAIYISISMNVLVRTKCQLTQHSSKPMRIMFWLENVFCRRSRTPIKFFCTSIFIIPRKTDEFQGAAARSQFSQSYLEIIIRLTYKWLFLNAHFSKNRLIWFVGVHDDHFEKHSAWLISNYVNSYLQNLSTQIDCISFEFLFVCFSWI